MKESLPGRRVSVFELLFLVSVAPEKVAQEPIEPVQNDTQVSRNERGGAEQKSSRDVSGNIRGRPAPRGRVSIRNRASKPGGQRVFDRHSGSDKT